MAHLREAEGDPSTAVALLDEAERVYVARLRTRRAADRGHPCPDARLLRGGGRGSSAWADRSGLSARDDLTYLHEYEHLTLARALLCDALGSSHDQRPDRGGGASPGLAGGGRGRRSRRHRASRSWFSRPSRGHAAGEPDPALAAWATRSASPSTKDTSACSPAWAPGTTGEPGPCSRSCASAPHHGSRYAARLLQDAADEPSSAETRPAESDLQPLVEPLSSRELDVLRLLRSDLDGPAIARELGVSLATMRTHTQHIYAKLAVTSRRAAVRRAHRLNLFARTARR